ncbi:MAG: putative flavoprotein involved in transport [Actinomycetota bacterium]|nr:putative flavoprotein involved in transport [Actinomycetota bacterium]
MSTAPSIDLERQERVVVVGAGPAGLAAAAVLKSKGVDPLVIDRATEVGSSWTAHYDRLHLHTVRWLSGLPGRRIPRREGRWVSRDGVVRYLQEYARFHDLRVQLSTEVKSIERDGSRWVLETSDGSIPSDAVVIATGYNREPMMPEWAGAPGFTGELFHSAEYKTGRRYTGKDVLIVGAGNSGAEIAVDLVESGARNVWLSVRSGPNILRRDVLGLPTNALGVVLRKLPPRFVDWITRQTAKLTVGDLTRYGLPAPKNGLMTAVSEERIPILDVGLIGLLKKGRVQVVAPIERFDEGGVVLRDGKRLEPHAVVAATGFGRGLDPLLGHLNVLNDRGNPTVHGAQTHPHAPNLYFTGYTNPISGMFRELGIDAKRIAKVIAG